MKSKSAVFLISLLCAVFLLSACGAGEAPPTPLPSATVQPTPAAAPTDADENEGDELFIHAQSALDELYSRGILAVQYTLDSDRISHAAFTEAGSTPVNVCDKRILPALESINCYTADGAFVCLVLDAESGKALSCSIGASSERENDKLDKAPIDINREKYYYNALYKIVSEDMTLDELCTRLCDYWGFDGYTLSATKDDFYKYDAAALPADTAMRDIMDKPYTTVYFDGDQADCPMFIEGMYLPLGTHFSFGYGHMVG